MRNGATRASENRRIRQDELRKRLSNGKHLEHAVDCITKINELDLLEDEMAAKEINRQKTVFDMRMRLVSKYLPDTKAIEISGNEDDPLVVKTVEYSAADLAGNTDPA